MRFFVSSLLISHLYLSLPSAALDKHTTDVDLQANHAEVVGSATGGGSWASLLSPSRIIEGIHLHSMSAVQAFTGSQPSPSDFWEKAKEYEQILQDYIPRLLKSAEAYFKSTAFTDITHAMKDIVRTTATFRNSIQDALDAHQITLDMLTEELEAIFMQIVHDLENIPPPSKAPGHAERSEVVNKVLDDTELALVNLVARYGIGAEVVKTYLDALRPHVCALTIAVGDINEQHPQLLPALAFSVAVMLIPESWILRPFLSIFGFGPAGPVKGSIAAWMQRYFWGAAVESGSWFAWLQAAGMGVIPKWLGLVTKAPTIIGGLLAMLMPYFHRGQQAA